MAYSKTQTLDLIAAALVDHEFAFSVEDVKNSNPNHFKKCREKAEVFLDRVTLNEGKTYWSNGSNDQV